MFKPRMQLFVWLCTLSLSTGRLLAKKLPMPDFDHSMETAVNGIETMFTDGSQMILLPHKRSYLILGSESVGETRQQKFGKVTDFTRTLIKSAEKYETWHGVHQFAKDIVLLNGRDMKMVHVSDTHEVIADRSIIWDLIQPPADRGGEAPRWELEEFRKRFRKNLQALEGVRFHGLSLFDQTEKKYSFLVGSRIKDFPILTMDCQKDEPSSCAIQRGCFVQFNSKVNNQDFDDIAYSQQSKILMLLDSSYHRIIRFRYQSCLHLVEQDVLELPQRMKQAIGLFVDHQDRLFVTTMMPDDYQNASVYVYDPKDWL